MKLSRRARRFAFALLALACGWSARAFGAYLPPFAAEFAPDALWAAMVFFLIAAALPQWPARRLGVAALLFAYAIECSQLYRAPWIDEVRANRAGALILGRGFLWSDLVCYTVGIGAAALIEIKLMKSKKPA